MKRSWFLILTVLLSPVPAQEADSFDRSVEPLLQRHCLACHGGKRTEGGLDLRALDGTASSVPALDMLLKVRDRLLAGDMPPPERPRPETERVRAALDWSNAALRQRTPRLRLDPGTTTIRRLSREEYTNSVRDLFGVETDAAEAFPRDDLGHGFSNMGDALTFSELHLEKYAAAAERIAAEVVSVEDPEKIPSRRVPASDLDSTLGDRSAAGDVQRLFTNGGVSAAFTLPRTGLYRIRFGVWADQAGPELAKATIHVDVDLVKEYEVSHTRSSPGVLEAELQLDGGRRRFALNFINDYYNPKAPDRKDRDRNLTVQWLEVVGPLDPPQLTAGHQWIFANDPGRGDPSRRARPVVRDILRRVWRRPPSALEVTRLAGLVKDKVERGGTFAEGVRLGLASALTSSRFLFRAEPTPPLPGRKPTEDLDPWSLATRLSYFLWSSTPDDELYRLAARRTLGNPDVLARQTLRMLGDDRASALATEFAAQWFELRSLADVSPDPERFPDYDSALARSLSMETQRFFEAVMRESRPVQELVTAEFTFLDRRLAAHYGIKGEFTDSFQRVELDGRRVGGVLGHGSVHAVTSNPTRTSPVKRGKWLLENLLGTPPPPPPPGAGTFPGEGEVEDTHELRAQMALHRTDPVCASCHVRMDALGLAMENFDPVGRWRSEDGGRSIDATGELPDGRTLDGVDGLKELLASDPLFVRCVARKLFVYAVGRDLGPDDRLAVEAIVQRLGPTPSISELVLGIVRSDAFRRRRVAR